MASRSMVLSLIVCDTLVDHRCALIVLCFPLTTCGMHCSDCTCDTAIGQHDNQTAAACYSCGYEQCSSWNVGNLSRIDMHAVTTHCARHQGSKRGRQHECGRNKRDEKEVVEWAHRCLILTICCIYAHDPRRSRSTAPSGRGS